MNTRVLFVCLGNICRSPTAHGVFETLVRQEGLADSIFVDSAGTGSWHLGAPPDGRTQRVALERGYDLGHLRARRVNKDDFHGFDYLLAMDLDNLAELESMAPVGFSGELSLFLDYAPQLVEREVPDPYYGGGRGFDRVLTLVESAAEGLLCHIRQQQS